MKQKKVRHASLLEVRTFFDGTFELSRRCYSLSAHPENVWHVHIDDTLLRCCNLFVLNSYAKLDFARPR